MTTVDAAVEASVIDLMPHFKRLIDHRDGLESLLRAMATSSARPSSTGRRWALRHALAAVPERRRDELLNALENAGDDHNEHWSTETADMLDAAVEEAAAAVMDSLAAAYRAGAS